MSTQPNIRRLVLADAAALAILRREALATEPLSFGSSLEDDRFRVSGALEACLEAHETQAVFAQVDGTTLSGMVGVLREVRRKRQHQASVWGLYVTPAARGCGVGTALLHAAIEHARGWGVEQLQLCVTEAAPVAQHLYEAHGFREWGVEPRALHWDGRFLDQHHLALALSDSTAHDD